MQFVGAAVGEAGDKVSEKFCEIKHAYSKCRRFSSLLIFRIFVVVLFSGEKKCDSSYEKKKGKGKHRL